MKSITSLALIAVAITSVNGRSWLASALRPRGLEEMWGGVNITAAALEIRDAISSPTCNATQNCIDFANTVVPRCLNLQGTAGCWCTLHDPLHYCAICMSSPADNTTTPEQTQAAGEGHKNYHTGCAAYQRYLNDTAAGTLSSSSALPSGTSDGHDDHDDHSGMATGTIVGIAVGGVGFVAVVVAATFLIWRCMKNQSEREARPAVTGAAGEKRQDSMPMGDPVRVTSYFGNTDMGGHNPHTPPPPVPYSPQVATYPAQPYSPPIGSAVPLLESMAARPDSMYTTAQSQPGSYNPAMRATSEFGGSSQGGSQQQQVYQPSQYHISNDVAPPPFSPHPQGYDTSLLVGVPAAPAGNEKARYQGSSTQP